MKFMNVLPVLLAVLSACGTSRNTEGEYQLQPISSSHGFAFCRAPAMLSQTQSRISGVAAAVQGY